ncbi:hypothetical protein [Ammoniphilus sp. CFH 90114]|uniref:hypothetical protein n=1 Tax=Ammoniphilus sp. CFH 90114 TaxID=2493665 RepID=UPI0013E8FC6B|nr:hypothetical protein [Ammoniphilus sp. CFH 90114]
MENNNVAPNVEQTNKELDRIFYDVEDGPPKIDFLIESNTSSQKIKDPGEPHKLDRNQ